MDGFSRRSWLRLAGLASLIGGTVWQRTVRPSAQGQASSSAIHPAHAGHSLGTVGRVAADRFNPMMVPAKLEFCSPSARRAAEVLSRNAAPGWESAARVQIFAVDREIEIAPGLFYPAWTYNGEVPGPTIRATEGDRIRITFLNQGRHPHTMHFHGWHPPDMDGALDAHQVLPGEQFVYEFDAEPFGLHLYHCHTVPLKRHIHKGLYGVFIIDPRKGRTPADELIMLMNGFDTNFDNDNEVYAVNTVANYFLSDPIRVTVGRPVRIYLVNVTEFDLINSLHLHGMFFDVYRTGTSLVPHDNTDTVMLCQGERAILETTFRYPGMFMFHAHQSEFAELGWMGMFQAEEGRRET